MLETAVDSALEMWSLSWHGTASRNIQNTCYTINCMGFLPPDQWYDGPNFPYIMADSLTVPLCGGAASRRHAPTCSGGLNVLKRDVRALDFTCNVLRQVV